MSNKKNNPQLDLYYFDECPFCQRVLNYLKENPKKVTLKNINTTPAYKDELIQIGGKSQVPCLVIGTTPMYESLDIIKWLEENA